MSIRYRIIDYVMSKTGGKPYLTEADSADEAIANHIINRHYSEPTSPLIGKLKPDGSIPKWIEEAHRAWSNNHDFYGVNFVFYIVKFNKKKDYATAHIYEGGNNFLSDFAYAKRRK